jgi:hypothetical protein
MAATVGEGTVVAAMRADFADPGAEDGQALRRMRGRDMSGTRRSQSCAGLARHRISCAAAVVPASPMRANHWLEVSGSAMSNRAACLYAEVESLLWISVIGLSD